MRKINEIIIHCSATDTAGYNFLAIKRDHVKHRGFSDIGYHFGIDWEGDIHILRPINKAGAHCRGKNRYSIGICVLGLQAFNSIQMEQLGRLVDTLCMIFSLKKEDIKPHNFYNKNKTCPNFNFDSFIDNFVSV